MTAYGRGEHAEGDTAYIAEIKSVNNRYRDINVRAPKAVQILEDEVRSLIASRIGRGRVDVTIQLEKTGGETGYAMDLNLPAAKAYFQILQKINEEFGLEQDIRADFLSQMKDVIVVKPEEMDVDGLRTSLAAVVGMALDSLDEMRVREGKAIEEDRSSFAAGGCELIFGIIKALHGGDNVDVWPTCLLDRIVEAALLLLD